MDIDDLSFDELLDLNFRVVQRIQYLHQLKTRASLDRFVPGDRVSFQSEDGPIEGLVVRVNRKTLTFKTKDSVWRVHPRFLTKLPLSRPTLPQDIRNLLEGK